LGHGHGPPEAIRHRVVGTDSIEGRERYELLTSLVVPRPIGWVSTYGADGISNLAPFSFFSAISATPMLVSLSIGTRRGVAKDSLRNILDVHDFCVNVVTESQLEAMNQTAADLPPDVDEFTHADLPVAEAESVRAPYVANCPAVFECTLFKVLDLEGAGRLIVGEVKAVRLDPTLSFVEGSTLVECGDLRPVGRLGGSLYTQLGEIRVLRRPGS
jgi:flavin reductase (DIM6/NTAB) family NADH-FMN oxidoreductase RutF